MNYNIPKSGASSPETKKWVWDVTEALIKGLKKGQMDFQTKGNLIAACIRGRPCFWFDDTLELVADKNFHGGRIVGIDIAGLADTACGWINLNFIRITTLKLPVGIILILT